MVTTTALLRRKDFAPHSCLLELTAVHDADVAQLKATLTGRASTSLEEVKLDLSGLFQQNHRNKKLRKLFKALGDLPHLKTLRFHYGMMERLPIPLLTIALSLSTEKLEILELNQVNLTGTPPEFEVFWETLRRHASLQVFSFSSSGCSSAGSVNQLLRALAETPKLEKVVLYSHDGKCPWGRLEGTAVESLCRSETLQDLQHLVLYDSSDAIHNFFTDEHTSAMARALSNNNPQPLQQPLQQNNIQSQLEEVMISCWPLGRQGVDALCQMLRTNTSLLKCTMVVYELGHDNNTQETCTMPELATALQSNTTLQSFEIHGSTELGKWLEEAFLIMIQSNYTLTTLKLCQDEALFLRPFLQFYLALNKAGRKLLDQNATREDWVSALIRVRQDLSCIFYFLSTNPLLCSNR